MIHLVTGGARSGKSRYSQLEAERSVAGPLAFVATAQALDGDMTDRIRRHREDRGDRWITFENPLRPEVHLAPAPGAPAPDAPAPDAPATGAAEGILLDCLTLWVSNLLFSPDGTDDAWILSRFDDLVDAARRCPVPLWIVTNEVGLGIVPADALSRRYRDLLGRCNQRVAAVADRVTLLVAGLPVTVR